jgi:tetratricopeptide (TPR) repeat protein
MPVERDRILGELAVEQGLIAREDAARFYAFLDGTPNPPPLSQLLVQEGRATVQDLQRLREIWQSRQGSSPPNPLQSGAFRTNAPPPPAPIQPPPRAAASSRPNGRPLAPLPDEAAILAEPTVVIRGDKRRAPAPFQSRPGPPPPQPMAQPSGPQPLDALGLKKDELLARILVARNLLTVDRAREARALQIQHKVRLGPVLARGNYVERGQLEEVIRYIREQVLVCVRCNTPQERGRLAGATACPRCGGALGPAFGEDPTPMQPTMLPPMRPAPPPVGMFAPQVQDPYAGGDDPGSVTVKTAPPPNGFAPGLFRHNDPFASARPGDQGPWSPAPQQPQPPPPGSWRGAPPPASAPAAPPHFELSQDELDPFAQNQQAQDLSAPPRNVSMDELNPFATEGSAFVKATPQGRGGVPYTAQGQPPPALLASNSPGRQAPAPFQDLPGGEPFDPAPAPEEPPPLLEEPPLEIALDSGDPEHEVAPEAPALQEGEPEPDAETMPPSRAAAGKADRKGPADKKNKGARPTRAGLAPLAAPPAKPPSAAGKIVVAIFLVVVFGGAAVFGGLTFLKGKKIKKMFEGADAAYDKKDWQAAFDAYQEILGEDKDQDRAAQRRNECRLALEAARMENEATARLAKAAAAANPTDTLKALIEDSSGLSEENQKQILARPEFLVASTRARRRLAGEQRRQGKRDDAAKTLDEAVKAVETTSNPKLLLLPEVALERLRLCDAKRSSTAEIAQRLKEVLQQDADGWCGKIAKGRSALAVGRYDDAISWFDGAIEKAGDPKRVSDVYLFRARAKVSTPRKPEAKADLDKAVELDPDDPRAYVELAKLALDVDKDPAAANAQVQKALERGPEDADVLTLEGELALADKKVDEASKKIGDAIKLDSHSTRARRARALIAIAGSKTYPEMEQDLEAAIGEYPDDATLRLTRGNIRFDKKLWNDAAIDLDVYLKVHGFDATARHKHATACLNLRRWDDAKKDLDEVIANDPKDGQAYCERGTIAVTKGAGADAIDDLGKAIDLLTGDAKAEPTLERAIANYQASHFQESLDDASEYLKSWPQGAHASQAMQYKRDSEARLSPKRPDPKKEAPK